MVKKYELPVVGQRLKNNKGSYYTVIYVTSSKDIRIQFDNSSLVRSVTAESIRKTDIKNTQLPSLFGVGILGDTALDSSSKVYTTWSSMLRRCYSSSFSKFRPSYTGCTVVVDWHKIDNFADWFNNQLRYDDYHLDKDLLVKNNKEYSPETCVFVPAEVNTFMLSCNKKRGSLPVGVSKTKTGAFKAQCTRGAENESLGTFKNVEDAFKAYKLAKENYAKTLAEKYKTLVDAKVITALENFTVKITD